MTDCSEEMTMRTLGVILSMMFLPMIGCGDKEEATMIGCGDKEEAIRWEEVQFRVCLRSEGLKPGDAMASGEFEDILVVGLPIQVKAGPGEAHTIQDGVWLHVAWDDVRVEEKPRPALVFEGFRRWVENRFSTPYGTSSRDIGWQHRGPTWISEEWGRFRSSVPIDSSGNDPRILFKMWRWVRHSQKPDIVLGQRRARELPAVTGD
jgi:hypothetical protein